MNPLRHPLLHNIIPEVVSRLERGEPFLHARREVLRMRRRACAQFPRRDSRAVLSALDEKASLLFSPFFGGRP